MYVTQEILECIYIAATEMKFYLLVLSMKLKLKLEIFSPSLAKMHFSATPTIMWRFYYNVKYDDYPPPVAIEFFPFLSCHELHSHSSDDSKIFPIVALLMPQR
jgi:hypothetical protein